MKTPKFKKLNHKSKLFTVNNFTYGQNKFLVEVGFDVREFAREELGYDLSKPKKLESFLRKCFRSYWSDKQK